LQDEELIQPKYTIATVCLMVVYKADGLIRYDTIEEFNVDSKAGLDFDFGTVEKLTLSGADRRLNMSFMKISYSQGARN